MGAIMGKTPLLHELCSDPKLQTVQNFKVTGGILFVSRLRALVNEMLHQANHLLVFFSTQIFDKEEHFR